MTDPEKQESGSSGLCSHNEWDPLEEVIVGRVENATIPPQHPMQKAKGMQQPVRLIYKILAGCRYPQVLINRAQRELEQLIELLEQEGVTVQRPRLVDFTRSVQTPHWTSKSGGSTANPRDLLLVVGDTVIEAPTAWRARYFETRAYRPLLKQYHKKGAEWVSAPKPELTDNLYNENYTGTQNKKGADYVTNEFEPVFDAADFVRCGTDLFALRSNTTNQSGINWLKNYLPAEYEIHIIPTTCEHPIHIDTTFIPLAPGTAMINPDFVDRDYLPDILDSWTIHTAPPPDTQSGTNSLTHKYLSFISNWVHLNVLNLDKQRIIVEESQTTLINRLEEWGFTPVPLPFMNYKVFGGGFHCATLDIRRRGTLESYF